MDQSTSNQREIAEFPGGHNVSWPLPFSCIPSLHVPMVVLAPPKTGSVTARLTIKESEYGKMLQSSNVGLEAVDIVPHLHWLSQESYEQVIAGLPIDDSPINSGDATISRREHMLRVSLQAACIRKCLALPGSCKTTIITTIRDPIAIYISSYFQQAALWNSHDLENAESYLLAISTRSVIILLMVGSIKKLSRLWDSTYVRHLLM